MADTTLEGQLVDAAKNGDAPRLQHGMLSMDIMAAFVFNAGLVERKDRHEWASGLIRAGAEVARKYGAMMARKLCPKDADAETMQSMADAMATATLAFVALDLTARACGVSAQAAAGSVGMGAQAMLKDLAEHMKGAEAE